MKRTRRIRASKSSKLASLVICYCLVLTIVTPFGAAHATASSQSPFSNSLSRQTGLAALSMKLFGSLVALWQGGGPPSVRTLITISPRPT
jgi:hypothetical protein